MSIPVFHTNSISRKLFLSLLLVLSLVAGTTLYAGSRIAAYHTTVELESRAEEYLAALTNSLALPLWNLDGPVIELIGETYSHNADIAEIRIVRSDTAQEYVWGQADRDAPFSKHAEIRSHGKPVGSVTITLDAAAYTELNRSYFEFYALALCLMVLTLALMSEIVLRRQLQDPFARFIEMVNAYAAGDEQAFTRVTPSREFSPLIAVLHTMGSTISTQMQALRESEGKYRRLVEHINDLVSEIDKDGTFLFVSPQHERVLGYSPQELLGRRAREFIHPDHLQISGPKLQEIVETRASSRDEWRFKHKNGEWRWLECASQTYEHAPGEMRVVVISQDITERKQAEEALRQSEDELKLTLDATTDGIWKWNFETDTMFFSPRYYTLLGYEPDEFPPTYEYWKHLLHPDDREHAISVAEQYLVAKPDVYENEFRLRTKRGDYRWIHSYARVVERHDTDEAIRMIGNHVDITDRKQAENSLKSSLEEKEVLLRELYHRTKNTLQVIRSMLLLQAARTPENAGVQKLVQDTEQRILAIALVHQKLYQSQDLSRINFAEYLRELAELSVQSFGAASQRIALVFECDEGISILLDTAIPCGLIVNELLTNAVKYAFPDGRAGEISIRAFRNQSEKLELHVADNGVGVPEGFDFRGQESFGLQTVIAIAEHQMQGRIAFTGEHGVACAVEFPDTLYTERV